MTHHEFERRLREIIGMDEVNMPSAEEPKRKRGRPPKDLDNVRSGGFHFREEAADAFRKAKAQHEQGMPYELTNSQFLMVLLQSFQGGTK